VSLTVTEAVAVNTLLQFVAGASIYRDDHPVDDAEFAEAVAVLVTKAHKTLMAGVGRADVEAVVERICGRLAATDSDGLAQATCRALADHEAHGGSIPWPSVRRPYEEWKAVRP
jgi:hypothetical protein